KHTTDSKTSFVFLSEQNEHIRLGGAMPTATTKLDTYKSSLLHAHQLTDSFELEVGTSYTLMKENEASQESTEAMDDKEALDAQVKLTAKEDKNTLFVSVARKSRMPAMSEMFTFFSFAPANKNVKPERSWQYATGYNYALGEKSKMNVELYYYDVNDVIIETNNGFVNKGSAEHYGAECRIDTKALDKNSIRISYAYANVQDDKNKDLAFTPHHKIILQDTIEISNTINAFLSYVYTSSQYTNNFPSDLDTLYKIQGYHLFDAQVSYKMKDEFSARVGIKNISDENYQWQYGFPAQGRSFYLSIEWKI
ncbi:TonB-dependent receptor, partial [Sulfurimonas sp. MAG313]